ncbi:putative dioxygenase [Fusarium austroafricanum]|uniref:Putative dioxygenase n=1 Tax=Fusarium austroafricanum TaxID=2364996 RepID=A0A8H4JB95_9HYPO|nr:putative dioxygenase [Fusarium austroafricanum]
MSIPLYQSPPSLVVPGDWVDFFRYVGETYNGVLVPENDDRDIKCMLLQRMMAAKDRFDVHFKCDYQPPEVGDWLDSDNKLAAPREAYFLRANTGPRWLLGGVMSRPFILSSQSSGKFSISSIESSSSYEKSPLGRWLTFSSIDHCFIIQEGLLGVKIKTGDSNTWSELREGQTLVIAAGETFTLEFGSRYVRVWSFSNGRGIEEVIQNAGSESEGMVLPETVGDWQESKLLQVCKELGVEVAEL